jgi:hypothetical protein
MAIIMVCQILQVIRLMVVGLVRMSQVIAWEAVVAAEAIPPHPILG